MKALICETPGHGLVLKNVDTPKATAGSAVIKVLVSNIEPSQKHHLSGTGPFGFPKPFTPGVHAIGRVTGEKLLPWIFVQSTDNPLQSSDQTQLP